MRQARQGEGAGKLPGRGGAATDGDSGDIEQLKELPGLMETRD